MLLFQEKLTTFILACQDDETGGFADRPGDMVNNEHFYRYDMKIEITKLAACLVIDNSRKFKLKFKL